MRGIEWQEGKVSPEQSGEPQIQTIFKTGLVQVLHTLLEPGQEVPWHFHSDVRDTFYAVRGPVTIFTRDPDGRIELEPGETFRAERGQAHRVLNETGVPAEFLLIQGIGSYDFNPL